MLTSKQFAANPFDKQYGEAAQHNPLRWAIYTHSQEDQLFHPQSAWFKCKDFFNEVTALYNHGTRANIYGFSTKEPFMVNPYGVFIRLKALRKGFYDNIEVLNTLLEAQLGTKLLPVPVEDMKDECLLLLPRVLFNSTYIISKVTLWIRCCNVEVVFESMEKMQELSPESLVKRASLNLLVPDSHKKYWFYAGKDHNSEKSPDAYVSLIHNNGFASWDFALEQENIKV